ncbi:hypothetical protein CRG49_008725 [Neisseria sp. N95_16]|nr:hypothetical protein CRG49_008725 [Neisseria sp. N95_16]
MITNKTMNISINGDSGATAGRDINIDKVVINQNDTAAVPLPQAAEQVVSGCGQQYSEAVQAAMKDCLIEFAAFANGGADYYMLTGTQMQTMSQFRARLETLIAAAQADDQ